MLHTVTLNSSPGVPLDLPEPKTIYAVSRDGEGPIEGVVVAVERRGESSALINIELDPAAHLRLLRVINRE